MTGGKYVVVLPEADVVWCGVNCGRLLDDDELDGVEAALSLAAFFSADDDDAFDRDRELLRGVVGDDSVLPSRFGDWLALLRPPEAFVCK